MTQQHFDVQRLRVLSAPLYAMAVMLILVPLSDLGGQLNWTIRYGALVWRTGAVGLLSGAVLLPTLGLLLALVTAVVFEHRTTQRVLAVVSGLATLATVGVLMLFLLDALQVRSMMNVQARLGFMSAAAKAVINFSLATLTLGVTCLSAWRAGRQSKGRVPVKPKGVVSSEVPLLGTSR